MVEIKNVRIEKIEEDKSKRRDYKSEAKTIRGLLLGVINKFRNDAKKGKIYTPLELQTTFEEVLRKFNKFYPKKVIKVEILQGYKDYDKTIPDIWKDINNNVLIRVWHKEGYEDKIIESAHINAFLKVLRRFKVGEEITCYRIAKELGYGKTEKDAWKNLWRERMTEYFPKYYRVCLFLEKIGYISYGKSGKVIRLR